MGFLTHLECPLCARHFDSDRVIGLCPHCSRPLLARYDLDAVRKMQRAEVLADDQSMWRFRALLPVRDEQSILSLGEGGTPLLSASRLGEQLGLENLLIKEESLNPTGSFKARGLSAAISRAKELGVRTVLIPSAGNAGSAAAAYAARAGIKALIYMPSDIPPVFVAECRAFGAEVILVDGLITDCGRRAAEDAARPGGLDLATLKEPYRLEGKKTLGFEIAEALGWALPDVIVYPTGGGTGLVGMWKAFDEMAALGWIGEKRPRMVAVQAEGCAPIPRAFQEGKELAEPWTQASTAALGLRVPQAVGDFLILRAIRESRGTALAVSDQAIREGQRLLAGLEGILACPEAGATVAALRLLSKQAWISPDETVVIFNTGTGLKYL